MKERKGAKRSSKEEQIRLKGEVEVLLSNPIFEMFFEKAEESVFNRWRNSVGCESEVREQIFLQQLGLEAFRTFIEEILLNGKMAQDEVDKKNKNLR